MFSLTAHKNVLSYYRNKVEETRLIQNQSSHDHANDCV